MFYKSMLHKHLTVSCAHTSIFFVSSHAKPYCPHAVLLLFHTVFWYSSLLVISYQLYYLTAVLVFPYLLEHIQSTSVLQAQVCALCNMELFEMITDRFSGSFLALTCAQESQLGTETTRSLCFHAIIGNPLQSSFQNKTKQQTFQKFRFHSIFNFPRLFLQLYRFMAKSKSNSSLNLLGPPTHVC